MSIYVDTYICQLRKITPTELALNDVAMKQDYNDRLPIDNIFNQINTAVKYAGAGGTPYTMERVVTTAFNLGFETGLVPDDCKL